jgi:hypothetical protein
MSRATSSPHPPNAESIPPLIIHPLGLAVAFDELTLIGKRDV